MLDITQAQQEQDYAKDPQNDEVKRVGHDMLTIDCPMENVNTVGHGQYIRKRADKYGQ